MPPRMAGLASLLRRAVLLSTSSQQIDFGVIGERIRYRHALRLGAADRSRARGNVSIPSRVSSASEAGPGCHDHGSIVFVRPIPFQHGKFRRVTLGHARDCGRPGRNRKSSSHPPPATSWRRIPARHADKAARLPRVRSSGLKSMQMRLVARRNHQRPAFDFGEAQATKRPTN